MTKNQAALQNPKEEEMLLKPLGRSAKSCAPEWYHAHDRPKTSCLSLYGVRKQAFRLAEVSIHG
jgi:hypothetical protein